MSLNMDKAIRGATKPKRAAPKNKYLEVLIPATARDDTLGTMFMSLDYRLKEHSWTIVFKSLIVVHILIRRGVSDKVLNHLVRYPGLLNVSGFKDKSGIHGLGAEQNKNIHSYAIYLEEKVAVYRELKVDFSKITNEEGGERLKRLSVAKGLLREVNVLQRQLGTLLDCKFYLDEIDNEITLCAFNLLIQDLKAIFQSLNEGVISVLDQYTEMSKIDAKDALQIYKKFVKQTEKVVEYLGAARNVQDRLGVNFDLPNPKHAPISLTESLEDYINDPDFETNRQLVKEERIKAQKAQKTQKAPSTSVKSLDNNKPSNTVTSTTSLSTSDVKKISTTSLSTSDVKKISTTSLSTSDFKKIPTKENDHIDFFSSIEKEHTVIFGDQYYQNAGTNTHYDTATNPFLAMQDQGIQSSMQLNLNQQTLQSISTIQDNNPFRSSTYTQDPAPISQSVMPYQNPFLQSLPTAVDASNPFGSSSSINSGANFQSQLPQQTIQPSITPSTTSNLDSNPFRRLTMSSEFISQQTQLTVFSQSMHSQDSSTSSFQSTTSTFPQSTFPSYSGF